VTAAGLSALTVRWAARVTSLGVIVLATVAFVQGSWPNPLSDTSLEPLAVFFFLSA